MKTTRLEHGYSILIHEDDTLYLTVKADDEIVELEGMKGYLYYYSECVDEEDIDASPKLTLKEMCDYAKEVFNDWSINADAIESMLDDLTPWFKKYAISEEEKTMQQIAELEAWINGRKDFVSKHMEVINSCRDEIKTCEQRIEREIAEISAVNKDIEGLNAKIAELKASLKEN